MIAFTATVIVAVDEDEAVAWCAMAVTKRTKPALPAALAKRAKAMHDAKRQRLADEGFKALDAIRALRGEMAGDFLEMGRALQVLKREGVAEAMGHASFEALCAKELDLSLTRANQLIALFERLDAGFVRAHGADRAAALMELADATPAEDSVEDLLRARLALPSGATLDVEAATVRALRDAAAAFRRTGKSAAKKGRGLTVSAAEQRRFDAALKRLARAVGAESLQAKLIATRGESGADAQVRMPLSALESLVAAASRKR